MKRFLLALVIILIPCMCGPTKPEDKNSAPRFLANNADTTVYANQLITFAVSVSDPDADTIDFVCINKPVGAEFNQSLGVFSWIPSAADIGQKRIIFSATDGHSIVYDTIAFEVLQQKQNSAVGTWTVTESGQTMTIVVNADNAFTMDLSGMATMAGTYSVSGNTITFTYTSCILLGQPIDCGDADVGTISGNQITIPNGDGTSTVLTKG